MSDHDKVCWWGIIVCFLLGLLFAGLAVDSAARDAQERIDRDGQRAPQPQPPALYDEWWV